MEVGTHSNTVALVADGVCVLRYDNEAGKGDHRHLGNREYLYDFRGPDDFRFDFWKRRNVVAAKRKVTISVVPLADMANASRAWLAEGPAASEAGLPFPGAHVVFVSTDLLWRTLSSKRLALLQVIAGLPAMPIREAARRSGRDIKAVHADVQVLLERGLVRKTEDGRIECPYDEIHLDVVLRPLEAAAA